MLLTYFLLTSYLLTSYLLLTYFLLASYLLLTYLLTYLLAFYMFLSLTYYVRTYFLRESLRIRRTQNLLLIGSCAPHESFSLLPLLPMSRQDTDPETRTNFDLVCAWFALKPALSERQQRKQQKLIHPDAVVEYDEDYDQKSVVWESFEAIKQKTRVSLGELHGITDQAVFDEKAQEHNYNTARRVRRLLTKMIENQENAEEDKAKWPDVLPLVLTIAPAPEPGQ